jgi:hypothetical protein
MLKQWQPGVGALVACVALTSACKRSEAIQCFEPEPVPQWTPGDLALLEPGSSRPLALEGGDGMELCGAGAGLGSTEDSYRYLVQRHTGSFELTVPVRDLSAKGGAGLMVRKDERREGSPYVAIAVHRGPGGNLVVQSSHRATEGGAAVFEDAVVLPGAQLPVRLRVEREGQHIRTAYAATDGEFTEGLSMALPGPLVAPRLKVGVFQFTRDEGHNATAELGPPEHEGWVAPPDLRCIDDLTIAASGASPVRVHGYLLESVTDVRIAGVDARIASRTPEELVLEPGAAPGELRVGPLVVESDGRPHALDNAVLYGGRPFIRGDVNEDGVITAADAALLRQYLAGEAYLGCPEAADLNGDGRIDEQDHIATESFLATGTPVPPAPYPEAGVVIGGHTCGLPPPPELSALTDENGEPLSVDIPLAEGDVVRLVGARIPQSRVEVLFGDAMTEVLSQSAREVIVRVREVPSAGVKCPVIFQDLGAGMGPGVRSTVFGLARGIDSPALRPDLCPSFAASDLVDVQVGTYDRETQAVHVPVPRDSWDPGDTLEVRLRVYLPPIHGVSRGSRLVRLRYWHPPPDPEGAPLTYEVWLEGLARALSRELNGGATGCGCDVNATILPEGEGVTINPCDEAGSFGVFEHPDPPQPDPVFPLKDLPPPMSGSSTFKVTHTSCDGPTSNPRLKMWCAFELESREGFGYPRWEYHTPLSTVFGGPYVADPSQRHPDDKFIMFTDWSAGWIQHVGYTNPCAIAAQAYYCILSGIGDFWFGQQMPPFHPAARVVKTFWLAEGKLPATANPDHYYSYQPPQGPRQYLGGIHLAVSTGNAPSYFTWGTFWVPKPAGDTTTKDGSPLGYNNHCVHGHGSDRPQELNPAFAHYIMCTDSAPGEGNCGNPWAPPDECLTMGCDECHRVTGGLTNLNHPAYSGHWMSVAWLPSFVSSGINVCFDLIVLYNGMGIELHRSLAPAHCQ